jgi:hypothetical protein
MTVLHVPLLDVVRINPEPAMDGRVGKVAYISADQIKPDTLDVQAEVRADIDLSGKPGCFQANDLLLPDQWRKLAAGAVCQVHSDLPHGYHDGELLTLRADPHHLDNRLLLYLLRQPAMADQIRDWYANQSNKIRRVATFLQQLRLPLPPLRTQREWLTQLNQASEHCQRQQVQWLALDQRRRHLFMDVFGTAAQMQQRWPAVPLPSLLHGYRMGAESTYRALYQGPLMILPAHLGSHRFSCADPVFLHEGRPPPSSLQIFAGDVLLDTGIGTAHATAVPAGIPTAFAGSGVALMRPKQVEPGFLAGYFCAEIAVQAFEKQITDKKQQAIKRSNLTALSVHLPPAELQKVFVEQSAATLPEIDEAERQWRHACKQLALLARQLFGS